MNEHLTTLIDSIKALFPAPVRAWLYGLGLASIPILVWRDVIEPEAAALAGPFLLALLNVPKGSDDDG